MYTTFNFSDLQSVTKINPQTNFLQYINLGMRYTKEEYEALRPSSKYPLVHEKRQFVIDYILTFLAQLFLGLLFNVL